MSLWLSAANSAAGATRGFWTAEMRRQQNALARAAQPKADPRPKRKKKPATRGRKTSS